MITGSESQCLSWKSWDIVTGYPFKDQMTEWIPGKCLAYSWQLIRKSAFEDLLCARKTNQNISFVHWTTWNWYFSRVRMPNAREFRAHSLLTHLITLQTLLYYMETLLSSPYYRWGEEGKVREGKQLAKLIWPESGGARFQAWDLILPLLSLVWKKIP